MSFLFNMAKQSMFFGGVVPFCINANGKRSKDLCASKVVLENKNENTADNNKTDFHLLLRPDKDCFNALEKKEIERVPIGVPIGYTDYELFATRKTTLGEKSLGKIDTIYNNDFAGASGGIKVETRASAEEPFIFTSQEGPKVVEKREMMAQEDSIVSQQLRLLYCPNEDDLVSSDNVASSNSFGGSSNGQLRRCVSHYRDLKDLGETDGLNCREPVDDMNSDDDSSPNLETIWEVDEENIEEEF